MAAGLPLPLQSKAFCTAVSCCCQVLFMSGNVCFLTDDSNDMWEDQEEDEDEDEGLAGQFLSDILSTNKYGKSQLFTASLGIKQSGQHSCLSFLSLTAVQQR